MSSIWRIFIAGDSLLRLLSSQVHLNNTVQPLLFIFNRILYDLIRYVIPFTFTYYTIIYMHVLYYIPVGAVYVLLYFFSLSCL